MNSCLPNAFSIKSVRKDRAFQRRLLDAMDRHTSSFNVDQRRHKRMPYRGRQVVLYTKQSGRDVAFIVVARNISRQGLGFLHGQMMHIGQACSADLATNDGNWINVEGNVVHCRHVHGMIHEIGLEFKSEICPQDLCDVQADE